MPRLIDAVVGDPVLGKVVSSNFFSSHAPADGQAAGGFDSRLALLRFRFPELLAEQS